MKRLKLVAVLACPSGVAHTYMASAALKKHSSDKDLDILVETQGALGIDHEISQEEIDSADYIIISNDILIY